MKLIADGGSTKTDWIITEKGKRVHKMQTEGINPFYQTSLEIATILRTQLLSKTGHFSPKEIYFYGAGCSFPSKQKVMKEAFLKVFNNDVKIKLESDLVAAARALFGNKKGIACILGTGSNSCHWDGHRIVKNVPPLGYILGDEGSGAVLGKLFIADLLKNQVPETLSKRFFEQYKTCYETLMQEVYQQAFPNRNLAKHTYFLYENKHNDHIAKLVKTSFKSFVSRNLKQYPKHLPVSFVGSVAVAFESLLREVLEEEGYQVETILQSPIEALAAYHSK